MKQAWILVLLIALFIAGCSGNKEENGNNAGAGSEAPASSAAASGEAASGEDVTIVFPAELNENGDVEGMTAEVKEAGGTNVVENADGSVSVSISRDNLDKLLEKYHSELTAVIEGVHAEGNATSIKELTYDEETFKEYNITVDKAAYESPDSPDGLVLFGLMMQSMMYQVYSGVDKADMKITFNMIDESTGETFDTSVFPEAAAQ
ncbi:hypothetical protein [Cohnella sp. GCM10027633]|uniref:hypothetical protein n=1 Tax=unclassified Cohnella TaxID=2636738 RepID=UPI003628EDDB